MTGDDLVIDPEEYTVLNPPQLCCKDGCDSIAAWQIVWGEMPDDCAFTCTPHIGTILLGHTGGFHGDEFKVYRIMFSA